MKFDINSPKFSQIDLKGRLNCVDFGLSAYIFEIPKFLNEILGHDVVNSIKIQRIMELQFNLFQRWAEDDDSLSTCPDSTGRELWTVVCEQIQFGKLTE